METHADHYEVLGISKNASVAEIKRAYRQLARQYHPDFNPAPEAKEKWDQVQKAYDILSDPEKRHEYDQGKKSAITTQPKAFLAELWDTILNKGLKR